jgi:hypothetical protein
MTFEQAVLTVLVAAAAIGVALGWLRWRARPAQGWPNWDDIPDLCMRCGVDLPLRDRIEPIPGSVIDVVYAPVGMSCESTGIAGWLCGPVCARAWNDQHNHVHHKQPENRT